MATRTLTGTYERILDEKLRIAIPKPLRRQLSQEEELIVFVVPGLDKCLDLFSDEGFATRSEKLEEHATNQPDSRAFFRLLFPAAEEITVDPQGRIRIPDRLVKHAGLVHDIVLVGVRDHAEIWDKTAWDAYQAQNQNNFDIYGSNALD
jgi:MraZ protein